jgi:hypothetical protein
VGPSEAAMATDNAERGVGVGVGVGVGMGVGAEKVGTSGRRESPPGEGQGLLPNGARGEGCGGGG